MDQSILDAYNISFSEGCYREALRENEKLSRKALDRYELDDIEQGIVWTVGLLAGLVDAFYVTDIRKLGSRYRTDTGGQNLSKLGETNQFIDERIKNYYSSQEIRRLESEYWVPYDPSTSKGLKEYVDGLNPKTHRQSSLGHDPILGFYYGVRDILRGEFTAIDNSGKVITQAIEGTSQKGLIKAICIQWGHLCSDLSTKQGLPIPFIGQLQRMQGHNPFTGQTYSQLIKGMYSKGYNLNHALAMGIPGLIVEVLIRISYLVYSRIKGLSWEESIPLDFESIGLGTPKLRRMLFYAYLIATACNGVKLYVSGGNIFAFNPNLWGACLTYGWKEFLLIKNNTIDKERHKYVMEIYNSQIEDLEEEINELLKVYG